MTCTILPSVCSLTTCPTASGPSKRPANQLTSWHPVPGAPLQNNLLSFRCVYSLFRSSSRALLPIKAESLEILQAFTQRCGWHFQLGVQIWGGWWLRLSASHYTAFGSWYVVYKWCDRAERERATGWEPCWMVARPKLKPCAFVVRDVVMNNYLWESQSRAGHWGGRKSLFAWLTVTRQRRFVVIWCS